MSVKLSKEESLKKISLRKKEVEAVVLRKPCLNGLVARVALVLDFSYSMDSLYEDGTVQTVIERVLPIGLQFDDNGEIDLWIYEDGCHYIGTVNRDNFYGLVDNVLSKFRMGGTKYAPVMKDVYNKYIVREPAALANYAIMITDGDNADKPAAEEVIRKGSYAPVFWQCVGIGRASFAFLEKLDSMSGRYVDNANFFSLNDVNEITDAELYDRLLAEFPTWLQDSKVQQMLQDPDGVKRQYLNDGGGQKSKGLFGRLFGG